MVQSMYRMTDSHALFTQDTQIRMNTKRQIFIDSAIAAGYTSPLNRADVTAIVESSNGAFGWPSWITADKARRIDRGVFDVPELGGVNHSGAARREPAPVATQPAPVASGGVKTIEAAPVTIEPSNEFSLAGSMVPSRLSTYVPFGHFKDVESILRSKSFYNIFITGLSGNGKTEMVTQVCAKLKRELFRVNITIETDEDDLLGGFRLLDGETVWQDGPVVACMKRGGVLLLDEIDLGSNKLMCLQPVLEGKGIFLKKTNQWIKPAAGFTVLATANTKGKGDMDGRFAGTGIMNEAMLDRFPVCVEQEYPTKATEKKIVLKNMDEFGARDEQFADLLVRWSEIIRKTFYEGAIDEIITTRRLNNIAQAFSIFGDRMKSIEMNIARFDDDTKEAFRNLYTKIDVDAVSDDDDTTVVSGDPASNKCPF
jgi:MoxR-like ATPase